MEIKVGDYQNFKVNNLNKFQTEDTTLVGVNNESRLGGVDHFMCVSIKTIVSRYVRRLKRDDYYGYPGAKYTIEIDLIEGCRYGAYGTGKKHKVYIPVECV